MPNTVCDFKYTSSHIKIKVKKKGDIYFDKIFGLTKYF